MGGGPDSVTTTTNSEPPAYLQGPLKVATQAAVGSFLGARPQYAPYNVPGTGNLPGQPTTPYGVPGQTPGAFNAFGDDAMYGNVLPGQGGTAVPASQPPGQQGGFLNGGSEFSAVPPGSGSPTLGGGSGEAFNYLNDIGAGFDPAPFLTAQFNRAADLTRTRLDSEFAGSGRNLGASMPARSEQLQTLAGQFFDPSRLFEFDPTNVLINRLGGLIPNAGGTSTSQQPVFNNGLFGFL